MGKLLGFKGCEYKNIKLRYAVDNGLVKYAQSSQSYIMNVK